MFGWLYSATAGNNSVKAIPNYIMKPKKVEKDWGYELWLVNDPKENYCSKVLHIKNGHASSMHFHVEKHETFYIMEGGLRVEIIDTQTTDKTMHVIGEGETFTIDRFTPHQLSPAGNNDVTFIETSTFHRDEDSYRVWR